MTSNGVEKAMAPSLDGNPAPGYAPVLLPVAEPKAGWIRSVKELAEVPSLFLLDLVAVALSLSLAFLVRHSILPLFAHGLARGETYLGQWQAIWLVAPLIFFLAYEGLYQRRLGFWQETQRLVRAVFLAMAVTFALIFAGRVGGTISRPFLILFWLNLVWALPLLRYWGKALLGMAGLWQRDILVLGAGRTGEMLLKAFTEDPSFGYRPVGFLDDDPAKQAGGLLFGGQRLAVLGALDEAERIMSRLGLRDVAVALPGLEGPRLVELVNRLQRSARNVLIVPDLFGLPLVGLEMDYLYNQQALLLNVHNNLADGFNIVLKRVFDLVLSVLILPIILPIMAAVALAIKLDSPGPVFYAGSRVGREGKQFRCYKFRSMILNNDEVLEKYLAGNPVARDEWARFAKLKSYDPRVTRVGRLIRRWSLDELPQILNVLKGEMSLVGPRPYLPRELSQMEGHLASIIVAAPGITGLWQVSGRNEADFEQRLQLDIWYARNWSLWLDMVLLLKTVGVVLRGKGAY